MRTVQLYFILAFYIFTDLLTVSTAPVPDVEDDVDSVWIDEDEVKNDDSPLILVRERLQPDDAAELDAVIEEAQDAKSAAEEAKDEASEAKDAADLANEEDKSIEDDCSEDVVIDPDCEDGYGTETKKKELEYDDYLNSRNVISKSRKRRSANKNTDSHTTATNQQSKTIVFDPLFEDDFDFSSFFSELLSNEDFMDWDWEESIIPNPKGQYFEENSFQPKEDIPDTEIELNTKLKDTDNENLEVEDPKIQDDIKQDNMKDIINIDYNVMLDYKDESTRNIKNYGEIQSSKINLSNKDEKENEQSVNKSDDIFLDRETDKVDMESTIDETEAQEVSETAMDKKPQSESKNIQSTDDHKDENEEENRQLVKHSDDNILLGRETQIVEIKSNLDESETQNNKVLESSMDSKSQNENEKLPSINNNNNKASENKQKKSNKLHSSIIDCINDKFCDLLKCICNYCKCVSTIVDKLVGTRTFQTVVQPCHNDIFNLFNRLF
ncbi:unnamed protein product [Diabrotica balteata]|uniref:Uncharacterized protein n=1 Tax=Diabrotica balteata TaxID=107213 RepID=A0A9N9SKM9_DIABA|nr:unnamed protein product [Diabrotica balteata]